MRDTSTWASRAEIAFPELPCSHEGVSSTGTPVGRRVVLGMVGLGVVGVLAGRSAQQAVTTTVGTVPGLGAVVPAAGGFRIYTVTSGYPEMDPDAYRLAVHGGVDTELSLSLTGLANLPQTQMTKDFQCVTGWRVDDVPWNGVLLSDILAAAGANPEAYALRFFSFDGVYTESLTMEQALRPDVLIATAMFGKPVTREHGGPVRLYVAPMYGYKSLKWLSEIEVVNSVVPGYWEQRGYDIDAWVGASNGRNDEPIA
jgi:DMSO/TMAO reductase YedYZ molybdopterin-dependent catalytic subunit